MGKIRELPQRKTTTTKSLLTEALLFTTMCIIGVPVEVHIKDGSIFSGIFHTASVNQGYGIVLKKARMIKKGIKNSNVSNGGLIDTLVILPGDLVQVVAKGVMLPADYVFSSATYYDEGTALGTIDTCQGSQKGAVLNGERRSNQGRPVGVTMHQDEEVGYHHSSEALKEILKVNSSCTSVNGSYSNRSVNKENHEMMAVSQMCNRSQSTSDLSLDVKLLDKKFTCTESVATEVPGSVKTKSAAPRSFFAPPAELSSQDPLRKTVKGSKLNPSAKVFSPSIPNFRSTPPLVPAIPSVAYVPNSLPPVQVADAQSEVGSQPIVSCSPWSLKYVPYVASATMNTDNGLQYNQSFAGHIGTRAQHMRHGAQYQQVQALPSYVHPSHQNGVFGRPGQLVYVRPVSHDLMQIPAHMSQAQHSILASHPIHVGIVKNEGVLSGPTLPPSMTPPLMTNRPQPYTLPSHIHQLSQPLFSSMRPPISIIGSNIPYSAKFS